jgi:hypothetical protein
MRVEAANKRKVRADRRRAEGIVATILVKGSEAHVDTDSDPSEELPLAAARAVGIKSAEPQMTIEVPPSSQPTPDTPPPNSTVLGSAQKKTARSFPKKLKGRNQLTKDETDESPARSMSRDIQKHEEPSNGNGNGNGSHSKPSSVDHPPKGPKGKGANNKMSMADMKRRVTAFLDFISRTQVELAGETASGSRSSEQSSPQEEISNGLPKIQLNGNTQASPVEDNGVGLPSPFDSKEFRDLNCVEMMDVLTRDLLKWQNQYTP